MIFHARQMQKIWWSWVLLSHFDPLTFNIALAMKNNAIAFGPHYFAANGTSVSAAGQTRLDSDRPTAPRQDIRTVAS